MKHIFYLRQIGILIGCFIGHLIVDNTVKDTLINILVVSYVYSFYDAVTNENKRK